MNREDFTGFIHCVRQEDVAQIVYWFHVSTNDEWEWYWERYGSDTCFHIESGWLLSYTSIDWCLENRYDVLEWDDVEELLVEELLHENEKELSDNSPELNDFLRCFEGT